ncbi:membrane cofactor protein isoform X35 [Gadus morhua]|uniref:membrane cofactor protein isoform X34 n=1 Tax=Gadus morhua TaxID=8049 RepID=UPI0011B4E7AA|nr:membrane cofactor protein-like isoform X34 [Gadus morhua]XP_030225193.1 membrane cofactor protein-like isoform X35 [Gadus morhua]
MVDSEQVLGCKAPMGLVLVLLLSSLLGPLGQAQAQDCEKPMRYTMSLTGEHIQKEHFPNGLVVTFECATGYRSTGGSGKTTCAAGTWTTSTLSCEKFNCGSLELVNGHVEYSEGTSFGSVATFSCKDGYILSGREKLTCGNTEWLGRTPTCSVVKCDSPPSVDKAEGPSPKRDLYDFASVVRYKCQKDYTINGSASLKCSSNGKFTPNPPTCLMVRCKAPYIPNGSQKSGARPPYVHRSLVEYECNPGFKMEGEGVMTCQLNSTWSSTPECKVPPVDPTISPVLPVDPTSSPVLPVDPTSSPVLPVDPTSSPVLPVDPTSSPVLPVDPTSSPVLPVDPTSSPVLPVDPTSSPVLPVDPTSSPGDSKTSSQFLWFLVLVPIVLAVAIGLTLKKRGSQSLRAPVPLEEDKIL